MTKLPEDEATRLSGVLGAVAAEAVTLPVRIRGALKHDAAADPERHALKDVAVEAPASMITPKPFGLTGTAAGAVGAVDAPHPASANMVTIEFVPMRR